MTMTDSISHYLYLFLFSVRSSLSFFSWLRFQSFLDDIFLFLGNARFFYRLKKHCIVRQILSSELFKKDFR